jgi:hypothetical protein
MFLKPQPHLYKMILMLIIRRKMKRLRRDQGGFIPMIIMLITILVVAISLAYWRVSTANK